MASPRPRTARNSWSGVDHQDKNCEGGTKNPSRLTKGFRLRLVLTAEKERKTKKTQNNYVKTDRSTGRAQSDAMTRARSAASASEDPSEVYAPESSNNKSQ